MKKPINPLSGLLWVPLVFCFGIIESGLSEETESAERKPNLIILFADDMGYGDLGCYGNPTIQTPNLDALASSGTRFTSFYSAPWCVPARVQLLLGKYPARVNLNGGTGSGGKGGIPAEEITISEMLKAAGYATGMIGKWHLGYQRDEYLPVGQGFDSWYGLPYSNDMRPPWVKTTVPLWLYEDNRKVEHPVDQDRLTTRYTERAENFIRKQRNAPFFLYLAYAMPHLPVRTRPDFRGRSEAGLYGDVIQTIDWSVGRIRKSLEETGQLENTLIVFTSDNGPWLNLPARMLQDGNEAWHAGSPGPFRNAKGTSYEGGVRVPCIMSWPGTIPEASQTSSMASTLDLYMTFAALAGVTIDRGDLDGYDLSDFLRGKTGQGPRREHYYFHGSRLDGVRRGPWKLRYKDGLELFHLGRDFSERYNVANDHPEIVQSLTALLDAKVHETGGRKTW